MGNVFRVVRRDLVRLLKSPSALVVVVALIVLPSLYTWFNVAGFWNPYDNTGNLRVCVVNEDEGAYTDAIGQLNMGDMVVAELEKNDQLGWEFTDRETAMEEVESGTAYAAFIMPSDFSADITTFLSGDPQRPQLEYYVNEKAGAVSPKITDAGANTLDETINSTFVSTVSQIVVETLDDALLQEQAELETSQSSMAAQLSQASASLQASREAITDLSSAASEAKTKAEEAKATLEGTKSEVAQLSTQLSEVSTLITSTQNALGTFTTSLMSTLDQSSILASKIATNANTAIGNAATSIAGARDTVEESISYGKAVAANNAELIEQLQNLADSMDDGDDKDALTQVIASLQAQNAQLEQSLTDAQRLYDELDTAAGSISSASEKVNTAVQGTLANADAYRSTLSSTTFPALNNGMSQLSATAAQLSVAVSNQQLIIDQAMLALDQLSQALDAAQGALGQTDDVLASLQSDLDTVRTDLLALGTSGALSELFGEDGLDAEKIADFMSSPTELQTEVLYPVNAYGSAMAPLFMNISLWIGVFMLLVILRQEVDDEGIENLTTRQRYWAKWLFLAPLVALQAIVCCSGVLMLGVETANVVLFYITAMFTSLTYLSIQYALALTLQHIGKGLCIILIFVQIPGATGLYPIEMTPDFFQVVYPLFPFTYGINALRETIAGFYGSQWGMCMGVLLAFAVAFFLVGLHVRPFLTNVNRMFAKQIKESGILNGEEAQLPVRRYRMERLLRTMSNRSEMREQLDAAAKRFLEWYPRLHRTLPLVSIAIPLVATVALSLNDGQKVIVLTVWLVWMIAALLLIVAVEYMRDRLMHELSLVDLSDDELRELFEQHESGRARAVPLFAAPSSLVGLGGFGKRERRGVFPLWGLKGAKDDTAAAADANGADGAAEGAPESPKEDKR